MKKLHSNCRLLQTPRIELNNEEAKLKFEIFISYF